MQFDRDAFFTSYRAHFGSLTQDQVDGLNAILDAIEADPLVTDHRHVAYMLATTKHECADTFRPITERGQRAYFDKYNAGTQIGKNLGNTQTGDGYRFRGRGFVQLTGRANYQKLSQICGVDLLADPDLALVPVHAYQTMAHGFRHGTFTGRKLSDYITGDVCDYVNARRCINRLDQADTIAAYARAFESMLRGAQRKET